MQLSISNVLLVLSLTTGMGLASSTPIYSPWTKDEIILGKGPSLHQLVYLSRQKPQWWSLFPKTLKAAQKKAERSAVLIKNTHLVSFKIRNSDELKNYFSKHPPLTPEGWILYRNVSSRPSFAKQRFQKQLLEFWTTHALSLKDQAFFVRRAQGREPDRLFELHKKDHINRIHFLILENHLELALDLLKKNGFSPKDPLWIALRFAEKKAYIQDKTLLMDYAALRGKNPIILDLARLRYYIRASQPKKAVQIWNTLPKSPNAYATQNFLKALDSIYLSLLRDCMQEGYRLRSLGKESEAQNMFSLAMHVLGEQGSVTLTKVYGDHASWAESSSLEGLLYFFGVRNTQSPDLPTKKALKTFLWLADDSKLFQECAAVPGLLYDSPESILASRKPLVFPERSAQRYKTRAYFWAGLCYERLGHFDQATTCFEKASQYPFFFYGQMALMKLGRPCKVQFSSIQGHQGFQSPQQQEVLSIIEAWKQAKGKQAMETFSPFVQVMIKDLMNLAQSPQDQKKVLEIVKEWDPMQVTLVAQGFLSDGPSSTFREAYPMVPLPIPAEDPALVYGITLAETCFNPGIVSSAGALGIMQIMPHELKKLARLAGLPVNEKRMMESNYSFCLGIAELKEKKGMFGALVPTIAAYNAGPHKVMPWIRKFPKMRTYLDTLSFIEAIPFAETRAYVPRVLTHRGIYQSLLGTPLSAKEMMDVLERVSHYNEMVPAIN